MITDLVPQSHVDQDFIWVAEYADGTMDVEYGLKTKKRKNFYHIDKSKLIRFGLIGHGMRLYYEVGGGFFKLNGQMYEFIFKTEREEYYITGQPVMYNNAVTYKDAEAWISLNKETGSSTSMVTAYNFGYNVDLNIKDVKFNFNAVLTLTFNRPAFFTFEIIPNIDLDGILEIRKNGTHAHSIALLLPAAAGEKIEWVVQ